MTIFGFGDIDGRCDQPCDVGHVMWNEEGVNLFWDVELIEYEDGILDLDAIA